MDFKYIGDLSTRIGTEWQLLGVHLGFSLVQMEQLQSAYPTSIPQCVSVLLNQWQRILDEQGVDIVSTLADALRDAGRTDLSDYICGLSQRKSTNLSGKQDTPLQYTIENVGFDGHKELTRRPSYEGTSDKQFFHLLKQVRFENSSSDPLHRYIEQSKTYMEQKLGKNEKFIKTRAFEKALDCLMKNGMLSIIGNAGDGKTTLAINILNHLEKQGYIVLVFSDPMLLEQAIDPDRQIVYFIDDAFGTPTLNKSLLEVWIRLYDKIDSLVSKRKMTLVITSRKIVMLKGKSMLGACERYAASLVDITDRHTCLTEVEKRTLIDKYCQGKGLFPMQLITKSEGYTPGFPLACKLYSTNQRLRKESDLLENPSLIIQKDVSNLLQHDIFTFCAMVLIVLHDGRLSMESLDIFHEDAIDEEKNDTLVKTYCLDKNTALSKIEDAIKSIIGVYVEEINDAYVFLHDSIFDAVCLLFGQKHPREVIRVASSAFIEQRIRTKRTSILHDNDSADVIVLNKNHFEALSKRWISDILQGHIRCVVGNPSIQDETLLTIFVEAINQLSPDTFTKLIRKTESSKNFLEFVFEEGYTIIATHLLKKIKENRNLKDFSIPTTCVIKAIERKNISLLKLLLQHGINTTGETRSFKTKSVHCAAQLGEPEILRILLEYNDFKGISERDFFGMQPIHYACQKANFACVKMLIEHKCDFEAEDTSGKRPIHYACYAGSEECVKILHKAGADIKKCTWSGLTPLHFAAMSKNFEVVCYLLDNGCNPNTVDEEMVTPVFCSCKNGRWMNIKALIHGGADPNIKNSHGKLPIHAAAEGNHTDGHAAYACIKILSGVNTNINETDNQGKTALHYLCAWSFDHRYDSVKLLVRLDADVNIQDCFKMQPLMYACNSGSFKCATLLLEYGGDLNCIGPRQNKPIHLASADGNLDIVKLLISKQVDINVKNEDGRQPIHFSCQYGNDTAVEVLFQNGADVNSKDNSGKVPLHYACKWGRTKTVKHLLKLGADPHVKDNEGMYPQDLIPIWATDSETIRQYLNTI